MELRDITSITIADVAASVGGRLVSGSASTRILGYSIDTRSLSPGDLFFAIRGPRFDGHVFVNAAREAGGVGAIVESVDAVSPVAESDFAIIAVAETVDALQRLARDVRRRSGARVVAITGSAGKTTTKEVTAELLSGPFRVFRNRGNFNNHIGLPLSLLELRHRPEIAVVELGMNHAGEISRLVSIAEPEVRVWTNVEAVHTEFFGSLEAVADAKAEILERARPSSLLVANADDARVMARARGFDGRLLTFGFHDADVTAVDVDPRGLDGVRARVRTPAGETTIASPLLGRSNLANVLAAVAVSLHFEVPLDDIAARAAGLTPAPHRGEVIRLPNDVTILDDSYNSNPAALNGVLGVVAEERRCARRIAVIGEMLEHGDRTIELHEMCGAAAARSGLGLLVTVGGVAARSLGAAAAANGMAPSAVRHFDSSRDAAEWVAREVRAGDLVLVKGSRGVRTEAVVDRLRDAVA